MASIDDPRLEKGTAVGVAGAPESPLRSYVAAKQSVAQLLREIGQLAERSAPWAAERVHDITVRLAEDRFQLVVVGQFKRGKTSLMNAIIGRPLLPTGTIPVTSAITSLRYGSTLRAVIRTAGQSFDEQVSIASLPDYITERGNPENQKHVLSANVEVPASFLRRGLHFIDTPGIGSAHEHNTATTLAFLPEADAAIFVTGADAPLSEAELEFLDAVHQHIRKLFFVLNKIDQVNASERDEVLAYTNQLVARRLGVEMIRLFPVSAQRVLAADASDKDALTDSGLAAFENALATFLNEDRRRVFLVSVLDRAVKFLEETRFTLDVRHGAISSSPDGARTAAELNRGYEEQGRQLEGVIDHATERIENWHQEVLEPAVKRFAIETTVALSGDLSSAPKAWSTERRSDEIARSWLREQLQRHAAMWLSNMTGSIGDIVDAVARDVEPEIRQLIDSTFAIAGSVFGVAPTNRAVTDDVAGDEPHFPVPRTIGVRLAAHRIARRIPYESGHAGDVLRDLVLGHLRTCVADIEESSARALADERRRVEQAIKPESQTGGMVREADVSAALARLDTLVVLATAARDALLRDEPLERALSTAPIAVDVANHTSETTGQETAQAVRDRVATGTCAICGAVSDAVFNFMCHYQYAIAVDRATQQHMLSSHGLCPMHTWLLERISSPRGLSMGYPSLLEQTAERMQSMIGRSTEGVVSGIRALMSNTNQCPACRAGQQAERTIAEQVVRQLETPRARAAFLHSQWLCLNHLQYLLRAIDGNVAAELVRAHARRLTEMAESMREYVLKFDARRRDLLTAEETRAYRQALVLLVGERNLVTTFPEND